MGNDESIAQKLFDAIRDGQLQEIQRLVSEKVPESTWLDYKLARANVKANDRGKREDWDTLSKACCGFANTEGGVIVWGVDARAPSPDEPDVPQQVQAINQFGEFSSWLEREAAMCVSPPVHGIQHLFIPLGADTGIAVTLVPAGQALPYRKAVADSKGFHFIVRAGSSFIQAPLPLLAGMFGRHPQPRVVLRLWASEVWHSQSYVEGTVELLIRNAGSMIARNIYANLMIWSLGSSKAQATWSPGDDKRFDFVTGLGRFWSAIGKTEAVLPPSDMVQPFGMNIRLVPPFDEDFAMDLTLGCDGAPPLRFNYKLPKEKIEAAFHRIGQSKVRRSGEFFSELFSSQLKVVSENNYQDDVALEAHE
jgi:hypothetical protein